MVAENGLQQAAWSRAAGIRVGIGYAVGELPAFREGGFVFLGQKGGCGSDLFGVRCRDAPSGL